jgi:two-component system response regulator
MSVAAAEYDVLLVEDNANDAEFAVRALRKAIPQVRISHVDDGARALDFLFRTAEFAERRELAPPRIVLLDLKLPKVDGLEVLRRVKAAPQTRSIPVTVLTSSKEPRDVEESYRAGANSYVVKPVNFEAFTLTLGQVVRYWLDVNRTPWHSARG